MLKSCNGDGHCWFRLYPKLMYDTQCVLIIYMQSVRYRIDSWVIMS